MNLRLFGLSCLACLSLGSALAQSETFDPAVVCTQNPQISVRGILLWGEDHEYVRDDAFSLNCPSLSFGSNGKVVTVKASDIFKALAAFENDAYLLSYYEDLRVRIKPDGTVTADPVRNVNMDMITEVSRILVTVTPTGGEPQVILKNAMPYVVKLSPEQAFTITTDTLDLPNPWPTVVVDPATGMIKATIGEVF